jgi:hypothetical protein
VSKLFHDKSLEDVLRERHAFRDALLSSAPFGERGNIQRTFDQGDINIERVYRGERPPPGSQLLNATATSPHTGKRYTFWTLEIAPPFH